MNLSWLSRHKDLGHTILRVGIGAMMTLHGWPKLAGGQQAWARVGGALAHFGIAFWPTVWGFLAAVGETLGGALLVVGLLTRLSALTLTGIMVVATVAVYHASSGKFTEWSHPAEVGIACLALAFLGGGKFGLDRN